MGQAMALRVVVSVPVMLARSLLRLMIRLGLGHGQTHNRSARTEGQGYGRV
jgi:hypothetical protein